MPSSRRASSRSRTSASSTTTSASSPLLPQPPAAPASSSINTTTTMADATPLKYTPLGEIPGVVASVRAAFDAGTTRPLAWRRAQLRALRTLVEENSGAFTAALQADLRRPEFECVVHETATVLAEIKIALGKLGEWTGRTTVPTPAGMLPGSSWTQPDPLGVALLIGPWNFPLQLILVALVGALAAGNAVVVKPSEVSPASAALLGALLPKYLDPAAVRVVQGAVPETTALLEQRWDVIWYTGNAAVARVVAAAAARHLTPTILELGGKCPAIVASDADIALAAKHIVNGKFINAGQVCLAPDYVLVDAAVEGRLLDAIKATIDGFYGPNPQQSASLARIVNGRHWARVTKLLDGHGGRVVCGGVADEADRYVAPTVISRPSPDAALMREEIFGPLLPVLPVASVDEAVAFVTARPREKPLALYVFTASSATVRDVLARTSSGAVAVNECVMQVANCDLPFGGVGESGMGSYHGHNGFAAFSHRKAVYQPSLTGVLDMGRLRYPPYTPAQVRLVHRLLSTLPAVPQLGWRDVLLGGLAAAVIALSVELAHAKGQW